MIFIFNNSRGPKTRATSNNLKSCKMSGETEFSIYFDYIHYKDLSPSLVVYNNMTLS